MSNTQWNAIYIGSGDWDLDCDATEENFRLAACAPELLRALQAIVKITDGSQPIDYPGALMVAHAAIAKATCQNKPQPA